MPCAISGLRSEGLEPLRRAFRLAVCLIVMSLLSACSPLTLVNLTSPNYSQTRVADIVFDEASGLTLDLYYEEALSAAPQPVVLFFYGGSWQKGSKEEYRFVASRLTPLGYRVVVADYRLYPAVTFPTFAEDSARAYQWTHQNIERYDGNPKQIYLMGHSAGAHIAALLHYDPQYLAEFAPDSSPPAGLIGLSGPYDFLPLNSATLEAVFPAETRATSQPIAFASNSAAPALLVHGGRDQTVGPGNAKRLARKATAHGNQATVRIYPKRGHAGVLLALTRPLKSLAPLVRDIQRFIDAQ